VYEGQGLLRTNPVAKTSVDNGLSPAGLRQAARAALELRRLGACEDDCWIWPSITQRAYQAAEIIAAANSINRRYLSHCVYTLPHGQCFLIIHVFR
jgi:broad specificity phosphatase PhoE